MRVTWVALEWPRVGLHSGGVGRYVERLAREVSFYVDLTVITLSDPVAVPAVQLHELRVSRGRLDRYYRLPASLGKHVVRTAPDIVHSHGDDWAMRRRFPTIRSFYGSSWSEAMASSGLRSANHMVLAATEHLSQVRSQVRVGIAPESVARFHCQYVMPPFVARKTIADRNPAAKPRVLFMGSYHGKKRGHLALRAVTEAASRLGTEIQLVVIGPEGDKANWPTCVEHLSGLEDAEVSQVLAETWLVLAPSAYEGFGIPVLEGLEHGVAVIASPNPGSSYIVRHSKGSSAVSIVADDFLAERVSMRLAQGPWLTHAELDSASNLVRTIAGQSSPSRLIEIYRTLLMDSGRRDWSRAQKS